MTKDECAIAFVQGRPGKGLHISTDGKAFMLRGVIIAWHEAGRLRLSFQGYYTIATAAHINAILKACNAGFKVSHVKARMNPGMREFIV